MIFKKEKLYKPNTRYYLTKYHPYRIMGEINPKFKESNSGLVLDLKEGKQQALDHFYKKMQNYFGDCFTVCRVPSSDPDNIETGIATLARRLAAEHDRIDGTLCLVRTKKIQKLAHGGQRDENVHLESVQVVKKELIEGKDVLLLDDVMTTGNSLKACQKLLFEAGACKVQVFSIAKTV